MVDEFEVVSSRKRVRRCENVGRREGNGQKRVPVGQKCENRKMQPENASMTAETVEIDVNRLVNLPGDKSQRLTACASANIENAVGKGEKGNKDRKIEITR
jgi:hypothetical protein